MMMPAAQPPSRTRFDMLLGSKEHEMHHRGQLMLLERIVEIVPHLTREFQERLARMQAAQTTPRTAAPRVNSTSFGFWVLGAGF